MPLQAADLVRLCAQARDADLWEQFVSRFGARLRYGVARALRRAELPFDEDPEDLLQEVYCKLLDNDGRSLARCRAGQENAVGAYLGRVAETVTIDRLRAAAAVKRGRRRLVSPAPHIRANPAERALDRGPSPEDRLLVRESRQAFLSDCRQAAGPKFPGRDFRVLCLAFLEGMSSREISRLMGGGMTPSGVDSLVHRAKRRLAKRGIELPRRRVTLT